MNLQAESAAGQDPEKHVCRQLKQEPVLSEQVFRNLLEDLNSGNEQDQRWFQSLTVKLTQLQYKAIPGQSSEALFHKLFSLDKIRSFLEKCHDTLCRRALCSNFWHSLSAFAGGFRYWQNLHQDHNPKAEFEYRGSVL